jgi:A/G-specific adenine glycosylase
MDGLSNQQKIAQLRSTVLEYYAAHGRHDMPWRIPDASGQLDPYKILVSEMMLQQTQVNRVIGKFNDFIRIFPTVQVLSDAPLSDVLTAWSGLGYYRRAKFLHLAAQQVVGEFAGQLPNSQADLVRLPGVGKNTAGAIIAYSFNQPVVFIETNIRTVFLHHFFGDQTDIPDSELMPFIHQALPKNGTRQWYWALMDYGSFLKSTLENPSRRSKHHHKQSAFKGSRREVRGKILKLLLAGPLDKKSLEKHIEGTVHKAVLEDLVKEGMISFDGATYHLGR